MLFLNQAFAIVNAASGSAIYHIITLFALEAAFAIALGHWRRAGSESGSARFAVAAGLSGAGRGLLFLLGAFGLSGLFSAPAILAPLDRAVSLATLILLAWSLAVRPGKRLADAALGLALIGLFVGAIASAIQWYALGASGEAYNPSDTLWELAKVGVLVLALAVLVVLRPADWGLAFGLFAVLLVGVGYHLLNPIPTDSYPAAERIAELAALPLFTVIVYRHALGSPPIAPPTPAPAQAAVTALAPAAVTEPIKIALTPQAASALAVMGATGDGQDLIVKITRGIGKTLLADLTLLFTPPAPNGTITCVGAYDLIREISLTGFTLPISKINVIVSAINRARPARLRMPEHQSQLVHIARALGVTQIGPAVMTPLRTDDHNYGAIMVFSAFGQKEWTNDDHALLVALAEPIVNILVSNENLNQLRANLQRQAAEAARRLEEAQTELRAAQEESKRNRQQAESLTAIIQAGPAQDEQQQSVELAALQTNYRRALEELAALNDQLAAAQAEQATLRETIEATEGERRSEFSSAMIGAEPLPGDQELAAINRQLADAQTEIMLLRSQLAKGQTLPYETSPDDTADEITALNEQWAVAQTDLDHQRSQLRVLQSEADQARMAARTKEDENAKLQSQIEKLRADLSAAGVEMAPAHPGADEQTQVAVMVSLAQDLRQPMSSIVGYTDLLMGESVGILGALQRTFLERIKASAQRMADILDDLIRLTAIDKGMLQLDHQTIDVIEVIEDAFTSLGIQFREKGVSLRMDIADDPLTLEADRDAIHQIISRLLGNACAVSQPNSEVVLTARMQDPDFLLVSVRDSGGGIPPADQPRVFAPVHRADRPLIQGLGDTGVGLSIAKALTEAEGGRIWVESEAGVGSTFSVLLPANGTQ